MMTAVMMLLALFVLAFFVREPKKAYEHDKDKPEEKVKLFKLQLGKNEKKSLLFILGGIFFWFTGYNAIETFFSLYATNTLDMTPGDASITLAIFSLTFLIFAVPSGFIGARIGRRTAILIGLAGLTLLFIPMIFFANVWLTRIILFLGGFSWAMVNVNSLPMVVRLSGENRIGTFIGYYYFFSFLSQIISPVLFGFIRDVVGHYKVLFLYSCIAFAFAVVCLLFVHHGEDTPEKTNAAQVLDGLGD
jgi:MFS family permease